MKQVNEKCLIEIANEIGWECDIEKEGKEYYVTISMYTPQNQDVSFDFTIKTLDMFQDEIYNCWQGYDPDEEAMLWYGKNNGEPESLRDLLDDMEYVESKLEELYKKCVLTFR